MSPPWTPLFDWNELRVAQLKAMVADGLSSSKIADQLGVTRNAVIGKIDRLKLARPGKTVSTRPRKPKASAGYALGNMVARLNVGKTPRRSKFAAGNFNGTDGPMPPQATELPAEPVPATRVTIYELTEKTCRWPCFAGDEPIHEKFYCGGLTVHELPYCGHHCRMAYTPTTYRGAA